MPSKRVPLQWTQHAERERNDRYGQIPKVDSLPLSVFKPIEVETQGNKVVKLVVRGHLTKDLDAVFVLIPGPQYRVKTVWINQRDDTHCTLDRSRYVC